VDLYSLHQALLRYGGIRRVEAFGLWHDVVVLMQCISSPHTLPGPEKLSTQLVPALREKAIRFLLWIEDEAPAAQLDALKALAQAHSPIEVVPEKLEALAALGLLGGSLVDLPPFMRPGDGAWR